MALFINRENQDLLWNVINKNPKFSSLDIQTKTALFKTNIEHTYKNVHQTNINLADLQEYNKQTIHNIINVLYKQGQSGAVAETIQTQFTRNNAGPGPGPATVEDKFLQYKNDYNAGFTRKEPPLVEFAEKEDTKITNMNELIERHKKERELDVKLQPSIYAAAASASETSLTPIQTQTQSVLQIESQIQAQQNSKIQMLQDKYDVLSREIELLKQIIYKIKPQQSESQQQESHQEQEQQESQEQQEPNIEFEVENVVT